MFSRRRARPSQGSEPRDDTPSEASAAEEEIQEEEPERSFPEPRAWNPDEGVELSTLSGKERWVLDAIDKVVTAGKFELPRLPSSVQKLMGLVANSSVDVEEIADTLSSDPSLSSEAYKAANSALFGAAGPVESLREAVVRLGLRRLRTIVLGMSMRSEILRDKALQEFGEEIWRQASSVAQISSELARCIDMNADHAYLMGLTHDIGKVGLLGVLAKQKVSVSGLSGAFLATMFVKHHEQVGAVMAEEWYLPKDVVAIAGHHHDPSTNPTHPREATLVLLAHRMDQLISMGVEEDFLALTEAEEMDTLGIDAQERLDLLDRVLDFVLGPEDAEAA